MDGPSTAWEQGRARTRELRVPHGCIALAWTDGRSVVRFAGEIDIAFSREDFAHLVAAVRAGGLPVDVDCSGVTFFGAEGIRMLVLLRAAAVDRRIGALSTSPALDRLGLVHPMGALLAAVDDPSP